VLRGTGYFPIGNKAGIGAGIFGIVGGGMLPCGLKRCGVAVQGIVLLLLHAAAHSTRYTHTHRHDGLATALEALQRFYK
jgi:hypothetical protein